MVSKEIDAAYISTPELRVLRMRQRYSFLGGGKWRYESLMSGFTAELLVDEHGFVTEYPGAFHMANSWGNGVKHSAG